MAIVLQIGAFGVSTFEFNTHVASFVFSDGEQLFSHLSHPQNIGSVSRTIDLLNGSWLPGNSNLPESCVAPYGIAVVSSLHEMFITCYLSNNLAVVNSTNGNLDGSIGVGNGPRGIAYDANNGYLYVADSGSNDLKAISSTSHVVVQTINVSSTPWGVAIDSINGDVYVTESGANAVSVISGTSGKLLTTIPVGSSPMGISFDVDANYLFVATYQSKNVTEINGLNNKVQQSIPIGTGQSDLTYDSHKRSVYVVDLSANVSVISVATSSLVENISIGSHGQTGIVYDGVNSCLYVVEGQGNVSVISDNTNSVVKVLPAGLDPWGIGVDSTDGTVYVANQWSNDITMVTATSNLVAGTFRVSLQPRDAAYYPQAGRVFVTDPNSWSLNAVSVASGTQIDTIPLGFNNNPEAIAYDNRNGYLYLSVDSLQVCPGLGCIGSVSVINGTTNKEVSSISLGLNTYPWGLTYDPDNNFVYVCNPYLDSVIAINTQTDTIAKTITVGTAPAEIAFDSGDHHLYVTNMGSNNVSIISDTTNTVISNVPVGNEPYGIAYSSNLNLVYVTNYGSRNVSVLSEGSITAIATIKVGAGPMGIIYNSLDGHVYVANSGSDNVSVISNLSVAGSISVGLRPEGLTIDARGYIYATDFNSSSISVVSPAVPPLRITSVALWPASASVPTGGRLTFNAVPTCSGGGCPSWVDYSWSLSNSLGTVQSKNNNSTVIFTSGSKTGTVLLTVAASLNGITRWDNATVTITAKNSPGGFLGFSGDTGYVIVIVLVVVPAAVVVLILHRRRASTIKEPGKSGKEKRESPAVSKGTKEGEK